MNINGWLSEHETGSPEALRSSIREALGSDLEADISDAPHCFVAAGERVLKQVLGADASSRDSALELLTADALLTYAFESATEMSDSLGTIANNSVRRIDALGTGINWSQMEGPRA